MRLLFWARPVDESAAEDKALAYVRWYTQELAGQRDATDLQRVFLIVCVDICVFAWFHLSSSGFVCFCVKVRWECEKRDGAMVPKFSVVDAMSLNKMEHMVPIWGDEEHTHFYVNKYASLC